MDRRLGRTVGCGRGHRHIAKARGNGDNRRRVLRQQMIDQRVGQPDRAKQIGGNRGLGIGQVAPRVERFKPHDPGIVDDHVERGECGQHILDKSLDRDRVVDIEHHRVHVGPSGDRRVQRLDPTPGDDYGVAQIVQPLGQRGTDAAAAAGDENGVAVGLHGGCSDRYVQPIWSAACAITSPGNARWPGNVRSAPRPRAGRCPVRPASPR